MAHYQLNYLSCHPYVSERKKACSCLIGCLPVVRMFVAYVLCISKDNELSFVFVCRRKTDFVGIDDTNVIGDIEFLCPVVQGASTNSTNVTASILDDGGAGRIIADCATSTGTNDVDSPKVTCSCCICR